MRRLPSGQHSGKALDSPRRGPGLEARTGLAVRRVPSPDLGSGELSREPRVGKRQGWVLEDRVARVVEQRTEDQLPGRAALELLALTRCCLAVKRDKPSGAVAAVPSCSECESHSLSHGARTWVIR